MESFTAVFTQDGDWVVGWVEEMPGAVAQERTLDEARVSLREALKDVLAANREPAREAGEGHGLLREPMTIGADVVTAVAKRVIARERLHCSVVGSDLDEAEIESAMA
jgi:predicted RNase H-like HicB family nuclease